MKIYNQPVIRLLALTPTDIINGSPITIDNDPYKEELEGWVKQTMDS